MDKENVLEETGINVRTAERQFAEIRLRACIRIGELSRELEKAKNQYAGDSDVVSKSARQR
jgi:hypothetical protein